MWKHLIERPNDPQYGEEIYLCGPDGEPNGKISKVKSVVSEDRKLELWEVIDTFNATRIITWGAQGWVEVEL